MAADDDNAAEREQAAIDAEKALSRRREAELTLGALRDVRDSIERRDRTAAGLAAEQLHRIHALHEQQAGRTDSARTALARAKATQERSRGR